MAGRFGGGGGDLFKHIKGGVPSPGRGDCLLTPMETVILSPFP
jgi:hypothetical protein